ncbi:translation initiation factor IF-2-like [Zalophus californianus]|uniref:Translation initiation factor IF-2-like n=1 Tax=Zalophus californianus TaxID=9704 RepID=A0A6J2BAI6_ZALCA|nr:translation initiation factor IF-2-like [Zalophus californianus]
MEHTATPGGLGLPCSHRQALALYQHLFRCPASLGQLQAALQQVQESRACRSGLELPTVLLEMERSRRAQQQLLWDLELLTGAGLSLFWPPWAKFCGLRDQAPCVRSQCGKPHGGTGGGPERRTSWGPSEPQDPPVGRGGSLGQERAELQKLLRTEIPQRQRQEDSQEHKQRPQGRKGEAPSGESEEVPKRQREKIHQGQSGEATGALGEEVSVYPRGEAPQSERSESPQGQRGNSPQCQRKEVLQEPRKETPRGGEVKALQTSPGRISQAWEVAEGEAPTQPPEEGASLGISRDFCRSLGEQKPQPGGRESPGSGDRTTQLTQDKTDGGSRESAPAAGEQRAVREGARPPFPPRRLPARPRLPGPGAEPLAAPGTGGSGQQEHPAALPGRPGLLRDPHGLQDPEGSPGPAEQVRGGSARLLGAVGERGGGAEAPEASKAAWPALPGGEKASAGVSAAQQETALQRLLELHRAARRRRRQAREQQRLRVLERLRLARNRHCRVHPLGPPSNPAQLPPQEDAAAQRRALREQLQRALRERTWRLRALGARNTQNFQQLLWPPGAEEPSAGEERSPFPAPSPPSRPC